MVEILDYFETLPELHKLLYQTLFPLGLAIFIDYCFFVLLELAPLVHSFDLGPPVCLFPNFIPFIEQLQVLL
jgi:hypothetical protein